MQSGNRFSRSRQAAALWCSLLAACCLAACGNDDESTSVASTSADAEAGLSVLVEPEEAGPGTTIKASVVNETEEQFTYGAAYELEREVSGGGFEPVKLPKTPVIEIGYVADPGGTGPPLTVEVPGSAAPGTYRVVIQRDVPGVGDLSGEFAVVGDF